MRTHTSCCVFAALLVVCLRILFPPVFLYTCFILSHILQIVKLSSKQNPTTQNVHAAVASMLQRLQALRQEARNAGALEETFLAALRSRLDHVKLGIHASTKAEQQVWCRARLDRILVDFLLREGHYKTADQLAKEGGVAGLVNSDLFEGSRQVEIGLRQHSCTAALEWCRANRARLVKLKSTLEFKIRLQEFVETLRSGDRHKAIAYAQTHFPQYAERHMPNIQVAMTLIVFSGNPSSAKHKQFFASERWDDLIKLFRNNNFVINSLASQSLLSITLQSGLSVLKSPLCYDAEAHNQNCPICNKHMNVLAAELPLSKHTNSKLVCGVSGALMNEDNPPMALPNGNVYGHQALTAMIARSGGITCPRTGDVFDQGDMQKVFVM